MTYFVLLFAANSAACQFGLEFEHASDTVAVILATALPDSFAVHELPDREWSAGLRYRISRADLKARFPEIPSNAEGAGQVNQDVYGVLNQLNLFLLYNHPSGFFGEVQSIWTAQSNHRYMDDLPGDDFWQHSVWAGYRFPRRVAEIRVGLLNLADRDYRLNPVNLYAELPRARTLSVSLKLNF